MEYLKEELEKIKKNGRSFLGIDGGNIHSDVWFCGLEFGSDLNKMEEYYNSIVQFNDKVTIFGLPTPYRKEAGGFKNSYYDRFLSAMYINIFEKDILVENNANIKSRVDNILENRLYNNNSEIFKLNLFPLGKKDTSWKKEITDLTGVSKNEYYNSIFNNRKAFLRELVNESNPKYIICTATNGMEKEFVNAFLNNHQNADFSCEYIKTKNNKEFKISKYKTNKTTIIVIPFLGRCNLNSYNDVICMANYLRDNYL